MTYLHLLVTWIDGRTQALNHVLHIGFQGLLDQGGSMIDSMPQHFIHHGFLHGQFIFGGLRRQGRWFHGNRGPLLKGPVTDNLLNP